MNQLPPRQSIKASSLPASTQNQTKKIQLFQFQKDPSIGIQQIEENNENYESKFLPTIKNINNEYHDPKWREYKIEGKNINNRAYFAITQYQNYLYLYGGYQVSLGVMSDFYRMNMQSQTFQWEQLSAQSKEYPGQRTRHTLCTHPQQGKLYLFGGQIQPSNSTNQIYSWDVESQKWSKKRVTKSYPPEIENHCSVVCTYGGENLMIVLCGFLGGDIGLHSNYVFAYQMDTNEWIKLFPENRQIGPVPTPRDGAASAYYDGKVFLFGGCNGHERFKDLWYFSLQNNQWVSVVTKGAVLSKVRSGHTMNVWKNYLIVFGGIHDITWELDDMFMFNIEKSEWILVDDDSSRRKDNNNSVTSPSKDGSPQKSSLRKIKRSLSRKRDSNRKMYASQKNSRDNSPHKNNGSNLDSSFDYQTPRVNMSLAQTHQKTLEEKKRKEQAAKKRNLLKLFEVGEEDKGKFNLHSPTSEAMKNSLLVIGNPKSDLKFKPGKLTEFGKVTFSKFLQPLSTMNNTIEGKRPCARDGHCAIVVENNLIILGGDRHQMSFNDIHAVDLTKIDKI